MIFTSAFDISKNFTEKRAYKSDFLSHTLLPSRSSAVRDGCLNDIVCLPARKTGLMRLCVKTAHYNAFLPVFYKLPPGVFPLRIVPKTALARIQFSGAAGGPLFCRIKNKGLRFILETT
jgi:hypothetical protein